jgi:hypothetical protein
MKEKPNKRNLLLDALDIPQEKNKSDSPQIHKDDSRNYDIPKAEKEIPPEEKPKNEKSVKEPAINISDLSDKLSKILKLFVNKVNNKTTNKSQIHENTTLNKKIQNYYHTNSPSIFIHENNKQAPINIETENKINFNSVLNNNRKDDVNAHTTTNDINFIETKNDLKDIRITDVDNTTHTTDATDNTNKNIFNEEKYTTDTTNKNTFNEDHNYNVNSANVKNNNRSIFNKRNKKINMVKFLSKNNSSYEILPGLEDGGIVQKPTKVVVGESGPEAIIPLDEINTNSTIKSNIKIEKVHETFLKKTIELVHQNTALKMAQQGTMSGFENVPTSENQLSPGMSMPIPTQPSPGGGASSSSAGINSLTLSVLMKTSLPSWRSKIG